MTKQILVIGCGNIGAAYDLDDAQVLTHVKAFSEYSDIVLTVSDIDASAAERVAARYNASLSSDVSDAMLKAQDIVSVCVPTTSHFRFLSRAIDLQVPVVICEKPVASSLADIAELERTTAGRTSVLVNYIRRFQPGYLDIRDFLHTWLASDPILAISVRYCRGFLNNAGHALDLLEFLLGLPMKAERLSWLAAIEDGVEDDLTRSGSWKWGDIAVSILGLPGTDHSIFEIDIYSRSRRVSIYDDGNRADAYVSDAGVLRKEREWTRLLENYMRPVVSEAFRCFDEAVRTNFYDALKLNRTMLQMVDEGC